jgi:hypothetical protein
MGFSTIRCTKGLGSDDCGRDLDLNEMDSVASRHVLGLGHPKQGSRAAAKLASVSTWSFEMHRDYDQLETFKPVSISLSYRASAACRL